MDKIKKILESLTKHYWECGKQGLVDAGKNTPIDKAATALRKAMLSEIMNMFMANLIGKGQTNIYDF